MECAKTTFIVMPVANEEDTIVSTLEEILSLNIERLYIVVVMDSYSKDNTKNRIEKIQQGKPICLLYHEKSTGVVSCYIHGFKYALDNNADYIIEMDAGGSHNPQDIPRFLSLLKQGYDCVFSSRFIEGAGIKGHPLYRILLSKYGTLLANLVLATRLSDMTSGFEAFNADILRQIDLDNMLALSTTHFFQTEIRYYCSKLNITEIPIIYHGTSSSLRVDGVLKCLKLLFELRKRQPIEKETINRSKIADRRRGD